MSDMKIALIKAKTNLEGSARISNNEDDKNHYMTKAKRMGVILDEIKK